MTDNLLMSLLAGEIAAPQQDYLITPAQSQPRRAGQDYAALRHHVFVEKQGLFARTDRDDADTDPATTVLVATDAAVTLLGGVRLAPAHRPDPVSYTHLTLPTTPYV